MKNGELLSEVLLESLIQHALDQWISSAVYSGEIQEVK